MQTKPASEIQAGDTIRFGRDDDVEVLEVSELPRGSVEMHQPAVEIVFARGDMIHRMWANAFDTYRTV